MDTSVKRQTLDLCALIDDTEVAWACGEYGRRDGRADPLPLDGECELPMPGLLFNVPGARSSLALPEI